jgi:hypoxia up-regulated 1
MDHRHGGRSRARKPNRNLFLPVLLSALVVLLSFPAARAALLAIDFGSENLKMCLVKPGRTPISIVVNEFSRRKSPSLVGVIAGDRVVGEEGSTMAVKRPQEVFLRTRDLLGRRADDPFLKEMLETHLLPYELAPHPKRGGAAALVAPRGALDDGAASSGATTLFPPEELVASVLQYAREAAEIYANGGSAGGGGGKGSGSSSGESGAKGDAKTSSSGRVVDTVLAVPAWWGLEQRRALADAASLAGLNVLALINGHSAAALQYGIERDFSGGKEKEQLVLLFDVGASSTEAALVRFSAYTEGRLASNQKHVNQFEVLDAEWDASAGANDLDAALMRHFAKEFDKQHPPPGGGGGDGGSGGGNGEKDDGGVLSSPKAVAKLRKQVRRTKEILSANAQAPLSAEELHRGIDYSATVTREQLETLAAPWFQRVAAVAERLLERQGVSAKDLAAVELLGGGSRVPGLQAALSKSLSGRALDRHLDADEAIAFGAGLFAANLSSTFRLRKFGMADAAPYGVEFESLDLELPAVGAEGEGKKAGAPAAAAADASGETDAELLKGESSDAEAADSSNKKGGPVVRALLPPGKRLPARRAVKFHNLTTDGFSFSLRYNTSSPRGLPPGVSDPLLARYTVSGIRRAVERYGFSGATTLRFEADHGGRVELASAECVVEREEPEEREVLDGEAWEKRVGEATAEAARRAAEDEAKLKKEEEEEQAKKAKESEAKDDKKAEEDKKEEEGGDKADKKDGEGADAKKASSPPPPPPKTTPRNLTAEYVSAAIANLTRPMKNVTFMRTRTYRVALDVAPAIEEGAVEGKTKEAATTATPTPLSVAAGWARPPLLGEVLEEARKTVGTWRARELKKREAAKARNDLEAHVIATREALGEEGGEDGEEGGSGSGSGDDSSSSLSPLRRASTPAERAALREALMDAEDWLYSDEGGRAGAEALRERLAALHALGAKASARAEELVKRPAKVREAREFLAESRAQVTSWAESKAWITAGESKKATAALDALEKWLAAQESAQAKKKDADEGAFVAADVEAKVGEAKKAFEAVASKPKPVEKKKKKEGKEDKKEEAAKKGDKDREAKKEGEAAAEGEGDGKTEAPPHEEL